MSILMRSSCWLTNGSGTFRAGESNGRLLPEEPQQDERREITVHRAGAGGTPGYGISYCRKETAATFTFLTWSDGYSCQVVTRAVSPSMLVRSKELFSEADMYLSGEIDPGTGYLQRQAEERR
ncbi:MAG: hypothetical protein MZV63_61560 [Marinilabiliales bacterium]|nr:hypothetical protein [Marinilabiliales bacterium]